MLTVGLLEKTLWVVYSWYVDYISACNRRGGTVTVTVVSWKCLILCESLILTSDVELTSECGDH